MDAAGFDPAFTELVERLNQGKPLVLLAGAGISATAGVRPAKALMMSLREEHPRAFRDQEELDYSEVFRRALPRVEDRRARIEAECLGHPPSAEHLWIAQYIKHRRLRAVITPNFDHLIEYALMRTECYGIPVVMHDDELNPGLWRAETPIIVKVHGDFLFEDIANLSEEVQSKLHEKMRHALLEMTNDADLLVVGYSGNDYTIVSLIGEMVRSRPPEATRVFWSQYTDEEPAESSLLGQLASSATQACNPISWLGPWGASACLSSLGRGLRIPEPVSVPFGINGRALTVPTHFARPLQHLAGSPEDRSAALAAHPRLQQWVEEGGVVLLLQESGTGGSTLLAAIAEAAGGQGLYYDTRFAERPAILDLLNHLGALAWRIGVGNDAYQLFRHGAVIALDGIDFRFASPPDRHLDSLYFDRLRLLAEAQHSAGSGALVIGTHMSRAELHDQRATWLPDEDRTYRLPKRIAAPVPVPPPPVELLLDILGLAGTAIAEGIAVRAAAMPTPVDWRSLGPWVERRGTRVTLREGPYRDGRRRERALVMKLADALVAELENVHPLRRLGLALEAEALYFEAGETGQALRMFLNVAEAGMTHPVTRVYFQETLNDYLRQGIETPALWRRLPVSHAQALAKLAVRSSCADRELSTTRHLVMSTLLRGRSYIERELITLPLRLRMAEESGHGQAVAHELRRILQVLIGVYRRARRARLSTASRASLALSIGAIWDDLGDQIPLSRLYAHGLRWSRRAKQEALRARNHDVAGRASDNEALALLKLGRLDDAENALTLRRTELGKGTWPFSDEKAVTFGNMFHLKLGRRYLSEGEAYFLETMLQCIALQRWHGVAANLNLLRKFAKNEADLPNPQIVDATINATAAVYPIMRF